MQTSSIAVATTVMALVVALAVSGVAMHDRAVAERSSVALGTATSANQISEDADQAGGPTAVAGRRTDRPGNSAVRAPGASEAGAAAPAAVDDNASSPVVPPADAGAAPPVVAAGDGSRPAESESRVELAPAAPGDWFATARVTDRTGLLGDNDQTVEIRVVVGPHTAGAQRIDVEGSVIALSGETVRYDGPGRRAFVLDVWTGDAERVRFTSQDGFLAVPSLVRPGSSWSWAGESGDRRTSLDSSLRLLGIRRATVAGGRELDVVDYEQAITLGGDRSLTITRRVTFAPEIGMPVSITEETKGTNATGSPLDRTVVFELSGTEPAPPPAVAGP